MAISGLISAVLLPFLALKQRTFATLYFAQTASLLGDAYTWVGLALLTYQYGRLNSAAILASALNLRVNTFIIFSPSALVLADRILIGVNIADGEQWKVFGSHFAFSHFWRAIAYPVSWFFGSRFSAYDFSILMNYNAGDFNNKYKQTINYITI